MSGTLPRFSRRPSSRDIKEWTDRELDDALLKLRRDLQKDSPTEVLDFYKPRLKARWAPDRKVKTVEGELTVVAPSDDDEEEEKDSIAFENKTPDARQSMQAKLSWPRSVA